MKYFVRALKYFLRLSVVCVVIIFVMHITEMSNYNTEEMLFVLTKTSQGWFLIGVTILASALYPLFGFRTRSIKYSIEKNRQQVLNALLSEGFVVKSETNSEMCFQAKSPMKRLMLMYEDEIKVTQSNENIDISGIGRVVVRVENRILNYIE